MPKMITFNFKSKVENIYPVECEILSYAHKLGYSEDARFSLRLAMDEAFINAIIHGNGNSEDKDVTVKAECDQNAISVTVIDQGNGFDQTKLRDPRQEQFLNCPNGRGVFLIRQFTHDVIFNEKGNQITFTIRRDQPISVLNAV